MTVALSPIAAARVQALLLPVGKVQRHRFESHVERLQRDSMVRLSDISPDARADKNMFSPLAFPNGVILYNLVTSLPPNHHSVLSAFETFRFPLVIIGIADAQEQGSTLETISHLQEQLGNFTHTISTALTSYLLLFDADHEGNRSNETGNFSFIPSSSLTKSTTIKTVMCDISAAFLAELTTFARSIQDCITIDTPAPEQLASQPLTFTNIRGSEFAKQPSFRDASPNTPTSPRDSAQTDQQDIDATTSSSRPSSSGTDIQAPSTLSPPKSSDRPQSAQSRFAAFRRDSSRDRRSTPVIPTTVTERARNKLKSRQSIIIGTLYLHAGRWNDAMREFIDGITRAKSISDHVWHAKGLENLLCAMILMAWGGVEFSVPQICYNIPDKLQSRPRALTGGKDANEIASDIQEKGLRSLTGVIPELVKMISDIYPRAIHFQGEALASLPQSQSNIRLAYLLAVMYRHSGQLTIESVRQLISGTSKSAPPLPMAPIPMSSISKQEIINLLFRAYPNWNRDGSAPLLDAAIVISSMSSVLAYSGLRRKQGLLMREFLSMLIPGLIQARKVGAAEVGIHPAASLAALHGLNNDNNNNFASISSGELELGFHMILEQLSGLYGALTAGSIDGISLLDANATKGKVQEKIVRAAYMKSFGDPALKSDVLKLCSTFSEALPNFKDVIFFAGSLLEIAGPRKLARLRSALYSARLSREEQSRLSSKIVRTLGVVRANDVVKLETDYWDSFLVRDLSLTVTPESELVVSHTPGSLVEDYQSTTSLNNPRISKPRDASVESVLVAGERSRLLITLQNPFEFEVTIERIELECEGVSLEQFPQTFILGPARVQAFAITVTAKSAGSLTVNGCRIKIQGCREQHFPIYKSSWSLSKNVKVKFLGLDYIAEVNARAILEGDGVPSGKGPLAERLSVNVIDPQPLLTTKTDSLSQSTITVLEGQLRPFTITVRNVSAAVSATFVRVSFSHALRESQMTTSKGLLGRTELHELDYLQSHQQPFVSKQTTGEACAIGPGESWSFTIQVLGRIGVTGGAVILDYTCADRQDIVTTRQRTFTRMLSVPFAVTVQPSITLQRFDVMPLSRVASNISRVLSATAEHSQLNPPENDLVSFLDSAAESFGSARSFLLLLDLKNASSEPLSASVKVDPSQTPSNSNWIYSHSLAYTSTLTIQPNRVVRIVVPLPEILVTDSAESIPKLQTLQERQFVVSASGEVSEEANRQTLELFWYRQALLAMVRGEWHSLDGLDTTGSIDVRGIQLGVNMLHTIRLHALQIHFSLRPSQTEAHVVTEEQDSGTDGTFFALKTTSLHILTATMTNMSSHPLTFGLQLRPRPAFAVSPQTVAEQDSLAVTRNFVWTGSLLKGVARLAPQAQAVHELGVCVLSDGRYLVEGVAREVVIGSREAGRATPKGEARFLGSATCQLVASG